MPAPSRKPGQKPAAPAVASRRKRFKWSLRLKLTLAFLLVPLAIGAGYGIPQFIDAWKAHKVKRLIQEAVEYQKKNDVDKAFPLLIEAYRRDSHNPNVLRWLARSCDANRGGAIQAVRYWKELVGSAGCTDEDRQAYLAALIRNSEYASARKLLESWPLELRGQSKSRNLEVALLHAEGKDPEAQGLLQRTLEADSKSTDNRLKLDQLNLSASFDDLREAARRDLWDLAHQAPDVAPDALLILAQTPGLSLKEANDVLKMVDEASFKGNERRRHDIIDGSLTAYPELGAAVLAREAKLAQGRTIGDNQEYFRWLVARGSSATVLAQLSEAPTQQATTATLFEDGGSKRVAPKAEVLRSSVLFATYANCLVNEQKWVDLERLLRREGLPFTPAKIELMKALCSQGMGAASLVVDDHLNAGLLYAAKTRNVDDLATVEAVAEKLDRQAIAVKACEVQAEDPAVRLDILKKEYSLQEDLRDADGMLRTALALTELRPGLRPYEERVHYLRLLTGQNLEDEMRLIKDETSGAQNALSGAQWVTAALASYLMGDLEGARLRLRMADLTGAPTGVRAVAAGLWAETGDPEKGFAIAERIIAPSTLLPEEQWFLKQALK